MQHENLGTPEGSADVGRVATTRTTSTGLFVGEGVACVRCGYHLRGIESAGVCPECGTPASESLKGTLLQHSSPEYVASLAMGILLIVVCVVGRIASVLVFDVGGAFSGLTRIADAVQAAFDLLLSIVLFWGYYKLTQPDPRFLGGNEPNGARRVVRFAAATIIVCAIASSVGAALAQLGVGTAGFGLGGNAAIAQLIATPLDVLDTLVKLAGIVAWVVQFFAMMQHVRFLGSRIPDFRLMRWSSIYMWLLPVLMTVGCVFFFIGPVVAYVLYLLHILRLRKHCLAIVQSGAPAKLEGMRPVG
jgi:hypothetical protein